MLFFFSKLFYIELTLIKQDSSYGQNHLEIAERQQQPDAKTKIRESFCLHPAMPKIFFVQKNTKKTQQLAH